MGAEIISVIITTAQNVRAKNDAALDLFAKAGTAGGAVHLFGARAIHARAVADAFEQVDLIASPTTPTSAFKIGEKSGDPLQMYLSDVFTISCNLAGLCGISVPCGFSKIGLPMGLQLLGQPFGESDLLRAAHAYEQVTDWHTKQPNLD